MQTSTSTDTDFNSKKSDRDGKPGQEGQRGGVEEDLVVRLSGELDVELANITVVVVEVVTKPVNMVVVVVMVVVTVVMVVMTVTAVVMEVVMISLGVVMVMVMIATVPHNNTIHNMASRLQLLVVVVERIPEVEPEGQLEGEPEVELVQLPEEDEEETDMLLMPEKPNNFETRFKFLASF